MMARPALAIRLLTAALVLTAGSTGGILCAQESPGQDPPERGVARMSIVNGEVSVRRGDSGEWVAAVVNAPLMVDDRIATGAGSRAEVQFDSATMIRIGANAEIRLAQLENGRYHLQVAHGTVMFRALREPRAQAELDTPAVSVRAAHIGAYRIYVQEDGQTEITVRLGVAEIFTPKGSEHLHAGQTMLARGDPADPEFRIVPAIARDEWDRWNEQRDREMQSSSSYRNVPQDIYGAEDLDNQGEWVNDPSYGTVWAPAVGPDWAPYQNGRWVWEDYYGWTWVSYDPWGWAPFHYGRWFYAARGWCWYPGGLGRHIWSPGLVAFFGFGPGAGVGFGFENVGWVALAPMEPLYPWWGRGFYAGYRNPAYFNHGVNLSSVNITNVYRNARVANAVASVPAGDFRQGRFTNIARATGSQFRAAGLVRGPLPVAPSAANLRYSTRTVAHVPRSSDHVRFFSRNVPPPVRRVPFAAQQRSLQQFSRQPVVISPQNSTSGGWRSTAIPPGGSAAGRGGWRPLNPPPASGSAGASGWQRFGEPRPAAGARSYSDRWNVPRPGYPQNNPPYRPSSPPSAYNGGRPQAIRVAPPVVRERSASYGAPRSDSSGRVSHTSAGGSTRGSGGGGSRGGGHQ